MTSAPPDYGWTVCGFVIGRRLAYRLRVGVWCEHPAWSRGLLVDLGRRKIRWCETCGTARI